MGVKEIHIKEETPSVNQVECIIHQKVLIGAINIVYLALINFVIAITFLDVTLLLVLLVQFNPTTKKLVNNVLLGV